MSCVTRMLGGKRDVRQVDGVDLPDAHVGNQAGVAPPQARVVADARQMHGERRAPAPGSQYRDAVDDGPLSEFSGRAG